MDAFEHGAVLPNPYMPGQVPRVLAGRHSERGLIRARLGQVATFGEYAGPLLTFHAPRGLGKTSLLRAGQRDAASQGFVSAWVAATPAGPLLGEMAHAIGRALARTDAVGGRVHETFSARLEKIGVELGVPGAKVSAQLASRPAAAHPAPIGALEDLLHSAAVAVRDVGGAGLLVCVDEAQAAPREDLAVLLNALQNIDGERERHPLTFLVAGLPSTPEVITRAATFGERGAFVSLDRLGAVDSRTAILAPASELGVGWDSEAADQVVADSAGYPYFLQLLAHAAWRSSEPHAGEVITPADVQAGYPAAVSQLRELYRARWGAATPAEQEFMVAMSQAGHETVSRASIAAAMQKTSAAVSTHRDRLIEKGVIEPAGHGLLRFTLPGFSAYVSVEAGGTNADLPSRDYLRLLSRNIHPDH